MEIQGINVRIKFFNPVIGTAPNNEDIYNDHIASKAPAAADITDEIETLGLDEVQEKGTTVFHRDENGRPFIYDYIIKGFCKEACRALIGSKSLTAETAKKGAFSAYTSDKVLDQALMPGPRRIFFEGLKTNELEKLQRPLRAKTMRGERVALACSEIIPEGAEIKVRIEWLVSECKTKNATVEKVDEITGEKIKVKEKQLVPGIDYAALVREWLDYGKYVGIGGWRGSGGYGRFTWEEIPE